MMDKQSVLQGNSKSIIGMKIMFNFIYQISNLSQWLSFYVLFSNLTWYDLIIQAITSLILEVYNTGDISKNVRHNFQSLIYFNITCDL